MQRYGISNNALMNGEVIEVSDDDESQIDDRVDLSPPQILAPQQSEAPMGNSYDSDRTGTKPERVFITAEASLASTDFPQIPQEDVEQDSSDTESMSNQEQNDAEAEGPCAKCGNYVFAFAAQAHARWHEQMDAESSGTDLATQ